METLNTWTIGNEFVMDTIIGNRCVHARLWQDGTMLFDTSGDTENDAIKGLAILVEGLAHQIHAKQFSEA